MSVFHQDVKICYSISNTVVFKNEEAFSFSLMKKQLFFSSYIVVIILFLPPPPSSSGAFDLLLFHFPPLSDDTTHQPPFPLTLGPLFQFSLPQEPILDAGRRRRRGRKGLGFFD